jgi:hypothetical protein
VAEGDELACDAGSACNSVGRPKPNNNRFLKPRGRPNRNSVTCTWAVMELGDRAWTAITSSIVRLA